jgi:hypothetical protein
MKKVTVKATEVVTVAKAKKSNVNSLKLRCDANNEWKLETRSLSQLVKYATKNEKGMKSTKALFTHYNKVNGTKVSTSQMTVKNVIRLASERELNFGVKNDKGVTTFTGGQKSLFSFWLLILTIGRLCREAKELKAAK